MNEFIDKDPAMAKAMDRTTVESRQLRVYNRLGLGFIVFLVCMLCVPRLVTYVVDNTAPSLLESTFFGIPLNYISMYLIGFPLMLLVLRSMPDHTLTVTETTPRKKISPWTMLALYPVVYAVMGIFAALGAWMEQLIGKSATFTTADIVASNIPQWMIFLSGVIIAPVMEEIIFRRMTYRKAVGYGKATYVMWSALIFGLFHLNFGQSIYTAALGVVLAMVMLRTGSVIYGILLHVALNFTGGIGIGSIIIRSGNETAMSVYGVYSLVLLAVGSIIGIVMLVRLIRSREPKSEAARKRMAFLNPGTLIYSAICIAIIISNFVG